MAFNYSKARFSTDRIHRYYLERCWDFKKPSLMVIGLNPSTADERKNDPTVTRCISYAKKWKFGRIYMMNIFAFRATDPIDMKNSSDPIGNKNDMWLLKVARRSNLILCAWGNHGLYKDRSTRVFSLLKKYKLYCLEINKTGMPKHPLYCNGNLTPILINKEIKND
jgi:hypothetical protein